MTEPVNAISSVARSEVGVEQALLPRKSWFGDLPYNAVLFGTGGAIGVLVGLATLSLPLAVLAGAVAASPLTWLIDRLVLSHRAVSAFNLAAIPAAEVASRGELDAAVAAYADVAHRFRSRPGLHALALFNAAAMRATAGDYESAIRVLLALDAFPGSKRQPALPIQIPTTIALFLGQIGRTKEGWTWLETARKRTVRGKMYDGNVEGMLLTRDGRFTEALAAYERDWLDAERVLSATVMRGIRARRAFALEKAGGRDDELRRLLGTIEPSRPDELSYLAAGWPEMADFLERHGLVTRSPRG